mgnify:FL=1
MKAHSLLAICAMAALWAVTACSPSVAQSSDSTTTPGSETVSVLKVGDRVGAFDPYHVAGPDKGSVTCPT